MKEPPQNTTPLRIFWQNMGKMMANEVRAYDPPCAECGMHTLTPREYHPYAACFMFKAGMKTADVRANLNAIMEYGAQHAKRK